MSNFNYIELFSGIGGFRSAFDPLGGNCVFASEIDSFATQSYRALYNGAPELHGDITQIDAHDIPDHDLLVGGFPCQAFSVAGQRKGFEEARGTLFFDIARIASAKQPRLMLLENVKGLLSHDGGKTFDVMCAVLNDIGYAIDFRALNSKHYGVPQNRERIFIVCDRDADHEDWKIEGSGVEAKAKCRAQDMWIRTFNFDWPTDDTVTTRLRDILEDNVDERYYLSEEKTTVLVAQLEARGLETDTPDDECDCVGRVDINGHDYIKRVYNPDRLGPTVPTVPTGAGGNHEPKIAVECVGNINPSGNGMNGKVYGPTGLAPTVTTNKGEGTKIAVEAVGCSLRTRSYMGQAQPLEVRDEPISNTLTSVTKDAMVLTTKPRYRIRKLTPLECWRLQGFSDEQHETVKSAGISDSQRYKQAGNAVTVSVISAIAEKLCLRLPVTDDEFEAMLA